MRWIYLVLSWTIMAANANPVDIRGGVEGNLQINNFNSGQQASASTFWSGTGKWTIPTTGTGVPSTVSWFSNDTPPANISRFGDPVFVGDAATNYTATNACPTGDWFTNFENTTSNGPCAYIGAFNEVVESKSNNNNATSGVLGAGQTKLNNGSGALGVMGFALNNNSSSTAGAFAIYGECDITLVNTHSGCSAIELDAGNFVSSAQAGLPDPFTQSDVIGAQIACGSGVSSPTTFPCGSAIQIVNNTQPFKVGLNFLTGGIASQTILGSPSNPAIVLPAGYSIVWYSAAGTPVAGITSDSSGNVLIAGTSLKFNGTTITVP